LIIRKQSVSRFELSCGQAFDRVALSLGWIANMKTLWICFLFAVIAICAGEREIINSCLPEHPKNTLSWDSKPGSTGTFA